MHANKDIPSEEVIRKMISEHIQDTHTEFPIIGSSGFIASLLAAADGLKSGIVSQHIHGYVQELSIYPDLHINLHSEKQKLRVILYRIRLVFSIWMHQVTSVKLINQTV